VIKGYTSGIDIRNVIDPKPELSQVEKDLLGKATGETKSPTEIIDGAVKSSGIPWLLLAGAAAALLS
jgi:hypothetical protein